MGNLRKWGLKPFIALIFAIFFFLAGMLYEWMGLWFEKPVEVSITNKSGLTVNAITLTYSGYSQSGQVNIRPPANEETVYIKYYQSGEGSFEIEATLGNGQVVKGKGGYVEAGYSFRKAITSSEIVELN